MSDIAPISTTSASVSRSDDAARAYARSSKVESDSTATSPIRRGDDQVEVSQLATMLSKLRSLPPIRQELVDRVRDEISRGVYETPDKIDAAVNELVRDF